MFTKMNYVFGPMPSRCRCRNNKSLPRAFVKMSAQLSSVGQYSSSMTPSSMGSLYKHGIMWKMAKAIIQDYVDKNAKIMPHRSRTTFEGDRDNRHVLVGVYKQQDILREVNIMFTSSGSKTISHSTLSRLWRTIFKQVSLCKSRDRKSVV